MCIMSCWPDSGPPVHAVVETSRTRRSRAVVQALPPTGCSTIRAQASHAPGVEPAQAVLNKIVGTRNLLQTPTVMGCGSSCCPLHRQAVTRPAYGRLEARVRDGSQESNQHSQTRSSPFASERARHDGSVIPLFRSARAGGPVTGAFRGAALLHDHSRSGWSVLQSGPGEGGEVSCQMGEQVRILDCKQIIDSPECARAKSEIVFTGLLPGEL